MDIIPACLEKNVRFTGEIHTGSRNIKHKFEYIDKMHSTKNILSG